MAPVRLSRLQPRMLLWLAGDEKRSGGMISSAHQELIGALPRAKGNISHSLRLVESQGFMVIGRTLGGKAESLSLTAAGHQRVANLSEVMKKALSMQKQSMVGMCRHGSACREEPERRACPLGKPRRGNGGAHTVGSKGRQHRRCPL